MTEEDKALLDEFHHSYVNSAELQRAIKKYLDKQGLILPDDARFSPGIDCVGVFVEGRPVLIVGLPPVSNYSVNETEHTEKYLRLAEPVAV